MGVTTDSSQRAFKEQDVLALYQRPRRDVKVPYRAVYIGVDPSGGGNSAFSICSLGRNMDGGVTVRLAFSLPQLVSEAHREGVGAPSNQIVGILGELCQVHGDERVEEQQRDSRRAYARTQLSLLLDKVRGDLMLSIHGEEQLRTLAREAHGRRPITQGLIDDVLDGVILRMGLVQRRKQRLQAREMLVERLGRVTEEHRPDRRSAPRLLRLERRLLALTVETFVCTRHS